MPVAATGVVPRQVPIPHLDSVADFATQQTLRLAWDEIARLQERDAANNATILNLVTAVNILEESLVALRQACEAEGIFIGSGGLQPPTVRAL